MSNRTWPLLLAAASLFLASCDSGASPVAPEGTDIPGILAADGGFTSLVEILPATGLDATLRGSGPFTVFAPTDMAFEFLGSETVDRLLDSDNRELLTRVIKFHIVQGLIRFEDLTDGLELQTLDGSILRVEEIEEEIRIGGALISEENIEADNGLIHGISDVLRSNLGTADRIRLTPILSRFADLAEDTGAIISMDVRPQVTVFAPIDSAFPLAGSPEFNQYISPFNTDVLERIIDFHIADGLHPIESLKPGTRITTIDGAELTLTLEDGVRRIGGRRVISEPVKTANGLIYLINGVLSDNLNVEQQLRLEPAASTFASNVANYSDLLALLSGSGEYTVFAPVNSAYAALGQDVLDVLNASANAPLAEGITRVHVVAGRYEDEDLTDGLVLESIDGTPLTIARVPGAAFVRSRMISTLDIPAENGVIHLIDNLIYPEGIGILAELLERGFTTQFIAVHRAGLVPTFSDPGPFSMFAFPNALYEADTKPMLINRTDLQSILLYHAANGIVAPLEHGLLFRSLEGTNRTIAYDPAGGTFRLDGFGAITSYNLTANGQLYGVDTLSVPPPLLSGR